MRQERSVRLFRNGRNQAVRIPREFELPGNEALMRREGGRLIIESVTRRSLAEALDRLAQLPPVADEEFEFPDPPPEPVEL